MSFLVASPESLSAQIYTGPGSAPMLEAAAAWEGLADELDTAASSFGSLISQLTSSGWQGPAASAMTAVAAPYAQWLGSAAIQALGAAGGAKAVAAVFEAARAAVIHPVEIALNRNRLISLARSNIFGLNAPAIAANEFEYEEMWATDVAAMVGYHGGASAVAQQLAPWQRALSSLPSQVAAATGLGSTPLPPAPAATAVEYGLIAGLLGPRLASGLRLGANLPDLPFWSAALSRAAQVVPGVKIGPALITQAAAQLSAVANNPALISQAVSQLSATVVDPKVLSQAALQLSAVSAAPTVLAAIAADPISITQAAARLSAVVANPAVLTQAAAQLSAVAANPAALTQAAAQLSAVAANPAVLTQAAAQLSAVAANPAALTQAAAQLSAVVANPDLLARVAV
ncbi:PPE family protein, partial [Mycobacterium sp. ML4]